MGFETIVIILQTVGPFTVLVTVYFLVTELKEQNRVARANARQNMADSHQKLTLAGLNKDIVKIKIKLKKSEELTEEEESIYLTHFSAILRARQNQHYQYTIGMLDEEEWIAMLSSFRTLLRDKKNLEIWDWVAPTFPKDFVKLVEEQRNKI
ncbi:uncharacterized protein METZ01_LOCUS44478 [marine metagenome]|uniref:Uncharacterized protein n=1 Tax=marine metagenome TaxID=408172 RepID=A0A381RK66_9ZZZZ|nr:hypothetical protein [Rhodobiaceae bacterium]|tara:strand:+ start:2710 stop:3165 length:456 start_codon:yes stop_codon:yes gene_type:complete